MNNAMTLAKELQSMKATDVIRNENVRNQFINVYNSIWKEGGEQVYEREAIYFNQQMRDNANLRICTGTSVFYSFIDLAVRGLSLAPGSQALCYLLPRNIKAGVDKDGNTVWEKCCNLTISGYGELVLRRNAGQIRHADNPVIVYEGDRFEFGEQDGRKIVNYMSSIPRKSNHIIACFMKITRADGTIDYSVMTESDWKRLENYSARNNSYYDQKTHTRVERANELYNTNDGQIDTGFLQAKCIKHAFKTYPKLNIGKGSSLESEIDTPEQTTNDFDPYAGVSDVHDEHDEQKRKETFAPAPDMSSGITINPEESEDDSVF